MAKRIIVFGGTGFVGRSVVRVLLDQGFIVTVFARNYDKFLPMKVMAQVGRLFFRQGNFLDYSAVCKAIMGHDVVINLVGILYERKRGDFVRVHSKGVENLAIASLENGVKDFIHVSSALREDVPCVSKYAISKIDGERILKLRFPDAIVLKLGPVFSNYGGFFSKLGALISRFKVLPVISGSTMELAPIHVDDVAAVIRKLVTSDKSYGNVYRLFGNKSYDFNDIMAFVASGHGGRCMRVSVPVFFLRVLSFCFGNFFCVVLLYPVMRSLEPVFTYDQFLLLTHDSPVCFKSDTDLFGIRTMGLESLVGGA